MLTREQKKVEIENLSNRLVRSKSLFLVRFLGMKVEDAVSLRKELRATQSEIKVVKNTLFQRALKENEEVASALEGQDFAGPNAVVFSYEDPSATAKVIFESAKKIEPMEIRFGWLDGSLLNKEDVQKLATLPSKPELQAKLLGTLQAPMSQVVRLMNEVPSGLVRTLNAKKEASA